MYHFSAKTQVRKDIQPMCQLADGTSRRASPDRNEKVPGGVCAQVAARRLEVEGWRNPDPRLTYRRLRGVISSIMFWQRWSYFAASAKGRPASENFRLPAWVPRAWRLA